MKNLFTSHKLITALFAALFTLTLHNISNAQTQIHVDAVNGKNEATGRGAAGKAYKSITFALLISEKSNLPDPWHVHIHPGTYNADPAKPANEREVFPIKLRSKMLFQGTTTAADCILDAQHLGETQTPILLGEDVGEVSIRNLTIQNMNRQWSELPTAGGIVFWDTGGSREAASSIEGCVVHNNGTDGVGTNLPLVLIGNTISNNSDNGVWTNTNLTVLNNTFRNNGNNNTFGHISNVGLKFEGNNTDFVGTISDNTFESNGVGRVGGFQVEGNLTGDVTRNKVIGNSGRGFDIRRLNGDISHNIIENNSWGGFEVSWLTGNVTHNTFKNNISEVGSPGGGFAVSEFKGNITHNTFVNNVSGDGAGFMVSWTFTGKITHNLFDSNSVSRGRTPGGGGAIHLRSGDSGDAEISNNIFFNNTSSSVGSMVYTEFPARFTNNLFMVPALSAGVSIPAVTVKNPECRFHNNIFSGMKTAIHVEGSVDLPITHNLFHNIGTDFVTGGGNDLAFWELLADGANNNIAGGLPLVDPGSGDFHPIAGSPTIDAGTSQYAPADDFDGVARPVGNAVDIGPYEYKGSTRQATFAPEDVNQDGRVSIADVIEVAQALGKQVSEKPRADVNGDGAISFADLVAIARAIAKARSGAAAPSQKAVVLDAATVQTWLQLARVEDDGSLMFREGIANLEQLLASLLPKKTVLLANYPNPFNPETWIPYRLAKPAKVSIAIHAANGQLVRVLALGTQSAGIYQHRSRAAYWNGKNEVGEPVASGVYFYTLTAGDFTATRKMLIRK